MEILFVVRHFNRIIQKSGSINIFEDIIAAVPDKESDQCHV